MDGIKKFTPRVSKRILLFIAGLVWGFAGFRVFTLGFFKFIFSKMFKKHTTRIVNSKLDKHCVFSFFDFKSYLIMGFMIFFGISVRNLGIFNPVYLGDFYMGLGAALFMAGVYFFVGFFTFDNLKVKYKIS